MRVVDPETPGLGGPQVPGGGMARKDRHTFLVGRRGSRLAFGMLSRAFGKSSVRTCPTAKDEVRPVFFLNPWGEDRDRPECFDLGSRGSERESTHL